MHRFGSIVLLFVAGCATPPSEPTEDGRGDAITSCHLATLRQPAAAIRLGVEYLPAIHGTFGAATGAAFGSPRHAPADPVTVNSLAATRGRRDPTFRLEVPWEVGAAQAIEDPLEELTVRFVEGLMGEDRRRMRREFGAPLLATRLRHHASPVLRTHTDEVEAEEEAEFANRVGRRLIRRPLRNALRDSTFISDIELRFERFKSRNLPMTDSYQRQHHGRRSQLGSLSMRLRINDDPLELVYRNFGFKFGSNLSRLRAEYGTWLSADVSTGVSVRYDYDEGDMRWRGHLTWRVDDDISVFMVAGDHLDFLAVSTPYSSVQSPMDGDHGLMFYVEHHF